MERIAEAQAAAGGGPPGPVALGGGLPPLLLHRAMPLPELRRHKRCFLRLTTNNTLARARDAGAAQRMFANYLRDQLAEG